MKLSEYGPSYLSGLDAGLMVNGYVLLN